MRSILLPLLTLLLLVSHAAAQVSSLVSYQGKLLDQNGIPVNATVSITLSIFDSEIGGTSLYTEAVGNVAVARGVYSFQFGAAGTGITAALSASSQHWMELSIDGMPQSPRQRILAVPFALKAKTADEAATVPDGAITAAKLAAGSVGTTHLAAGAATANLAASGQIGVASGGVVLSAIKNPTLVNAGFVEIGTATLETGVPSGRFEHTAVWTGSEMIVFGGRDDESALNDGARFDPSTNGWEANPATGAPSQRFFHSAIWTGTEMIIWGGSPAWWKGLSGGGRYQPSANSWIPLSPSSIEAFYHTVVWTGTEMIVWGGQTGVVGAGGTHSNGQRFSPTTNAWSGVSEIGAPSPRSNHTAVWTGTEMIVWGGDGSNHSLNSGGRYNPTTDSWTPVSTTGAPASRLLHTAVWTGTEMIVWGGVIALGGGNRNDGGRYNPTTDSWTPLNTAGTPSGRQDHTAIWTGTEMVIWGGRSGSVDNVCYGDGAGYNPTTNTWRPIALTVAPSPRCNHTAVWTGTEMIIWGGLSLVTDPEGAPGSFLLRYLNDGARYDPVGDNWIAIPSSRPMILYQKP